VRAQYACGPGMQKRGMWCMIRANIIVGATFDDSLEGIIRVSVVATGVGIKAADARPTVSYPTDFWAHAPR
jgi:cell division GTPase FtsZ